MAFCLVHLQRHFANPEEDYPKPIVDHEAASKARCLEPSDKLDILQMYCKCQGIVEGHVFPDIDHGSPNSSGVTEV
jgi:hypothetical protein